MNHRDLKPEPPRSEEQWTGADLRRAAQQGRFQEIEQARVDGKLSDILHGLKGGDE